MFVPAKSAVFANPLPADFEVSANLEVAAGAAAPVSVDAAGEQAEAGDQETGRSSGLATAHPKPEKRKNARERALDKFKDDRSRDGTTPMTATAKSRGQDKVKDKAADKADKAKVKAQKADTKARKISAAKAAKAARLARAA